MPGVLLGSRIPYADVQYHLGIPYGAKNYTIIGFKIPFLDAKK